MACDDNDTRNCGVVNPFPESPFGVLPSQLYSAGASLTSGPEFRALDQIHALNWMVCLMVCHRV
jgi:hypothetical protein